MFQKKTTIGNCTDTPDFKGDNADFETLGDADVREKRKQAEILKSAKRIVFEEITHRAQRLEPSNTKIAENNNHPVTNASLRKPVTNSRLSDNKENCPIIVKKAFRIRPRSSSVLSGRVLIRNV